MAFTEDLSAFFGTDAFSITVRHIEAKYPSTYATYTNVSGILSRDYVESAMIQGYVPVFMCDASDISGIAQNDWIIDTGNSVDYRVREYRSDGSGLMVLVLEAQ